MFDETLATRAARFVELLKLTDDFHGQPFALLPWQRQIVRDVFGTLNERGIRQYRTAYIEIPKKNGKSALVSAVALYHLFKRDEPNGEIYGCAGDRNQASIVFDTCVEMIMQDKTLEKKVKIRDSYKLIENVETGTTYKVLSAESFTKHGYRPSVVLFDELHVQPNRDLFDTMTKGAFLARRQPLLWVITTSGDDPDRVSIGWEVHEKAKAILDARTKGDTAHDIPNWYPVIYAYEGEDIWNEEHWHQANPSLGHTLQVEDLREIAAEAKLSPSDERSFRWLNLNQWPTTKLTAWLPLDLWDMSVGTWSRKELEGRDCYLGMDLSTTTDLSALCLLFPPQEGQDDWRVIWEAFIPEDTMHERAREDKVPYPQWAADAWITPTAGNMIDYSVIETRIAELSKIYNILEVDADKSFAAMLLQRLDQEHGLTCVDVPQQYTHLTDPMNTIEILLRQRIETDDLDSKGNAKRVAAITHEDNPVARWCFGNTSIAKNGNGQIKYVKERRGKGLTRTKRIDLVAAWVCAMARARFYNSEKSVYEERGFLRL